MTQNQTWKLGLVTLGSVLLLSQQTASFRVALGSASGIEAHGLSLAHALLTRVRAQTSPRQLFPTLVTSEVLCTRFPAISSRAGQSTNSPQAQG